MLQIRNFLRNISVLAGLCLLISISAQAASLTVNTTADSGAGSLRQALIDATVNAEANIVTFNIPMSDPGYDAGQDRFTITLLSALPNIPLATMTINNPQSQGLTVKGNNTFRIFTLVDSAVTTINNVTISDGFSSDGMGGGIYMSNSGTLTLNRCTVSGNTVTTSGGGIYMSNSTTLHLHYSTVRSNSAASGGGIYIFNSGTLNMIGSTVNGNAATDGGGIYNGTSGTVNTTSSTIDGNSASSEGGGIYNTATVTAINNTFSANSAEVGGAIYNAFTATLINNIVATNVATSGTDLFGTYAGTWNLIGNIDGSTGVTGAPNRTGTTLSPLNPMLGLLQNNGGPTFTRSPLMGSPAIDKGNSATVVTDQHGASMPVDNPLISNDGGNGADMGSVEVQFTTTAAGITVGGRVFVDHGRTRQPLSNATVTLTDMDGVSRTTRTGSFGYFRFADVQAGETYIVTIKSKRYQFGSQVITPMDQLTEMEFVYYY
ncbi:MAG: carboxypeptidase regulatory-like domain-containing protein [Chloracidobacterium sp.]|nr:carboxypeptidase regulatory-like domain-containing protein [Chloracidobacterium sp.]